MTARLFGPAWVAAIDLADWYDQQASGSGDRFFAAVDAFVATLATHPRLHGRVPGCPRGREVRHGLIPGFLVVAVYEVRPDGVLVISLGHARSIRQTWRQRLPQPPTP